MKKTRLFIALLVMLVAASGYAQDSYRQAVKDYMKAVNQLEKEKALISSMSMMFDRDGKVDIDQLTKRYLDEQYENDMIDFYVFAYKGQGITEADLRELSSLLTTPESETLTAHTKSWMMEYASYMITPFMEQMSEERNEFALMFIEECVKEGLFRSDIDYNLLLNTFDILCRAILDNELYKQYGFESIVNTLDLTFIRGVCTPKGLEIVDSSEYSLL